MASARAPKQWCLSKSETVTTFESWRSNIQYTLSLDNNFAPYLVEGSTWLKKTKATPLRGYQNDIAPIAEAARKSAAQKVMHLELMLGQISNYCPIISRNTIIKNSTSIESVWQSIRTHFGFQTSGSHFLDFANLRLECDERPEDLFQRLTAFVEDNLITKDGGLTHHGEVLQEDEEVTPTIENIIVLTWLRLLHPELPRLVKQRYGTELRSRSIASIKSEISQAIDSLLSEISTAEETKVLRTAAYSQGTGNDFRSSKPRPNTTKPHSSFRRSSKCCPLCKQAGRVDTHFLSQCRFLPEQDRKFMTKARQITIDDDDTSATPDNPVYSSDDENTVNTAPTTYHRRVEVKKSPYLNVFYKHFPISVLIDSGAETNLIKSSVARRLGIPIKKSSQVALQADGTSPLCVIGEIKLHLTRDDHIFQLEALVVDNLEVDILAGVPFMFSNDITIRPAKRAVILNDGTSYSYGHSDSPNGPHAIRRTQAYILRAPSDATTIWPGDFIELDIPPELADDITIAIEPRIPVPKSSSDSLDNQWPPPSIFTAVGRKVRIPNDTNIPKVLHRHEHFCHAHHVVPAPGETLTSNCFHSSSPKHTPEKQPSDAVLTKYSQTISLDPDNILPTDIKHQFERLHERYDRVFDPKYPGYNGAVGKFEAVVNMGPVQPPQRKGRMPLYAQNKLVELQTKFDELEVLGVFKKPEDEGIVAEYLNPSFLVKKPNGGHRLVTAFADVGRYSKPQPSLMPDVDSTLRRIAQWKYLISTDLTSSFYQIPLSKDSLKYCGVATPFRGVRVYTRTAMGMPGSETALEELMSRILGDLLVEGSVAKLADDLYCGGNTLEELILNWTLVLEAFAKCDMRLSATKTTVTPKTCSILGWIWDQGTLRASPHRVATLATCAIPTTVHNLRSFIGTYKVLSRVLPDTSRLIAPLDEIVAGGASKDKISWTDNQLAAFTSAQQHLCNTKTVTLPRSDDVLWIVTDGAVKSRGIGSTLYIIRDNKPMVAGFFSAKLRKQQVNWLPCEVEALGIAASVKHFSAYITQSCHTACILTDSKPCVQAYEKLCRGEFSASPRVATFLTVVSRYQVSVRHISGCANVVSDFASRNAPECDDAACRVCEFILRTENSVVRPVTIQDVLADRVPLPFTSRAAWIKTQSECRDLRRTHAHLIQGTRPTKKTTDIRDVKRYLNVSSMSTDGLLIVKRHERLAVDRDLIIVPRDVLDGLLTAIHIKLDHPSSHQLKTVVNRYFYALDLDKAIDRLSIACHVCASLKKIPKPLVTQSSCDPPCVAGVSFAADILKRNKQLIMIVRETVTSYTTAMLVSDERRDTVLSALIQMCLPSRPLDGPHAVVRVDSAPAFKSLVRDSTLAAHRITIELGHPKNINKNPVAERAVQEVENELLKQGDHTQTVTSLSLSIAIARLNSRIRSSGLSAREMWCQRDQFSNSQISTIDHNLIREQHARKLQNHPYSERSKNSSARHLQSISVVVGDLIYLHADGSKNNARDRYIVISVDGDWCNVRKFVGSQFRATSYRVKRSDCYTVTRDNALNLSDMYNQHTNSQDDVDDSHDDRDNDTHDDRDISIPPELPQVPIELSMPPADSNVSPAEACYSPLNNMSDPPDDSDVSSCEHPQRPRRLCKPPSYLADFVTE